MFVLVVRMLEDVPQVIGNDINLNAFHQEVNLSEITDADIYEQETIRWSPLTIQDFQAFFHCQQEQIARCDGLRTAEGNFDWAMQEFNENIDMQELLENNEEQEDNIEMQEDINEDDMNMEDSNISDPNPEEVENIEMGDPWKNFET